MNLDTVLARRFEDIDARYDFRDTILYALGTGYAEEPLDPAHLRYLYEDGLVAAPTMANVLGHPGFWVREPEHAIDWPRLLHAEQRLTMHGSLPAEGHLIAQNDIMGVRDRGAQAGAMLFQRKTLRDAATDAPIATVITTLMLRGDGGCGDAGEAPETLSPLPEGPPDEVLAIQTHRIMPLIYRLSGDYNPLHIDPAIAVKAGFARPILHGLATKGLAGYALLRCCGDLDPSRLTAMAVRFTKPVMPGDLLRFEFWRGAAGSVRFRAMAAATGDVVLDRGTAEMTA